MVRMSRAEPKPVSGPRMGKPWGREAGSMWGGREVEDEEVKMARVVFMEYGSGSDAGVGEELSSELS